MRGIVVGSRFFSRSLPAISRQRDRAVRRTVRRGASKSAARMEIGAQTQGRAVGARVAARRSIFQRIRSSEGDAQSWCSGCEGQGRPVAPPRGSTAVVPLSVSDSSRNSKSGDRVVPWGPHGHAQANDDQPCSCRCVKSGRGSQAKTEGNQDVVKVTHELLYAEKESFVEGCGHERLPFGRIRVSVLQRLCVDLPGRCGQFQDT